MSRAVNIESQRYGKLVVKRFIGSKSRTPGKRKHRHFLCECDCGKTTIATSGDLRQGHTISCGCSRRRYTDAPIRQVFQTYQSRCRAIGRTFEISLSDFTELIKSNCHYCGAKPENKSVYRHFNETECYNGIDRVDNSKGYITGNCIPCCVMCNKAKRDVSHNEFLSWIARVFTNLHLEKVYGG